MAVFRIEFKGPDGGKEIVTPPSFTVRKDGEVARDSDEHISVKGKAIAVLPARLVGIGSNANANKEIYIVRQPVEALKHGAEALVQLADAIHARIIIVVFKNEEENTKEFAAMFAKIGGEMHARGGELKLVPLDPSRFKPHVDHPIACECMDCRLKVSRDKPRLAWAGGPLALDPKVEQVLRASENDQANIVGSTQVDFLTRSAEAMPDCVPEGVDRFDFHMSVGQEGVSVPGCGAMELIHNLSDGKLLTNVAGILGSVERSSQRFSDLSKNPNSNPAITMTIIDSQGRIREVLDLRRTDERAYLSRLETDGHLVIPGKNGLITGPTKSFYIPQHSVKFPR